MKTWQKIIFLLIPNKLNEKALEQETPAGERSVFPYKSYGIYAGYGTV